MADAIHIRPARLEDAAAMARIQVDSYRSAYAGILPQDDVDQFSYGDQEGDWIRLLSSGTRDVILVAETGDTQLVGYALGGRRRRTPHPTTPSWCHSMFGAPFTGRGSLAGSSPDMDTSLAARGCTAMMPWVLEANPTRAVDEHRGAKLLGGDRLCVGAREVAYGWPDLRAIASGKAGGTG